MYAENERNVKQWKTDKFYYQYIIKIDLENVWFEGADTIEITYNTT
jgi:hypothetical protein